MKGDGHGSWVDPNGRIVGRTIEGELVFNSGRKPSKGSDPLNPGARRQAVSEVPPPSSTSQAPEAVPLQTNKNQWKKQRNAYSWFGRLTHRQCGHEKLLDKIKDTAESGAYTVYPSHSQDNEKNPIGAEDKVLFMKNFPAHASNIVYDQSIRTIIDALTHADVQGYQSINLVVGSDRQKEFEELQISITNNSIILMRLMLYQQGTGIPC